MRCCRSNSAQKTRALLFDPFSLLDLRLVIPIQLLEAKQHFHPKKNEERGNAVVECLVSTISRVQSGIRTVLYFSVSAELRECLLYCRDVKRRDKCPCASFHSGPLRKSTLFTWGMTHTPFNSEWKNVDFDCVHATITDAISSSILSFTKQIVKWSFLYSRLS